MTIGITTWNGRVSPVLDVARKVELYGYANDKLQLLKEIELPGDSFELQAAALRQLKLQVLICGAVSRPLALQLQESGIELFPFTSGNVSEVIAAWMDAELPLAAMRMPGCRGRSFGWCAGPGGARRGGRRGGHQGGGRGLGCGGGRRPPLES